MSYRIQYETAKHPWDRRRSNGRRIVFGIVLCAVVLLLGIFGERLKFLLPGDSEVTAVALEGMAQNLQEGDSLKEALTAFCREVLDGAEVDR